MEPCTEKLIGSTQELFTPRIERGLHLVYLRPFSQNDSGCEQTEPVKLRRGGVLGGEQEHHKTIPEAKEVESLFLLQMLLDLYREIHATH